MTTFTKLQEEAQYIYEYMNIVLEDDIAQYTNRGNDLAVYINRTGMMLAEATQYLNKASNERLMDLLSVLSDKKLSAKVQNTLVDSICYEERLLEMERREQESLEKAKKYAAQKRELQKRQKAEESRKRTHRLCVIGGAVESVLGYPIEEEDIPKLIGFLKRQEANGRYFSKAMQKEQIPETEEV